MFDDIAFEYRERHAAVTGSGSCVRVEQFSVTATEERNVLWASDTDITQLNLAERNVRTDPAPRYCGRHLKVAVWEIDLQPSSDVDLRTRQIYGVPWDLDPLPSGV